MNERNLSDLWARPGDGAEYYSYSPSAKGGRMSDSPEGGIEPALTTEEWHKRHSEWGARPTAEIRSELARKLLDSGNQHGAAAVLFYGQPFGFTREDLALLAEAEGDRFPIEDEGWESEIARSRRSHRGPAPTVMNRRSFVGFSLAAVGGIFVPRYGSCYRQGSGLLVPSRRLGYQAVLWPIGIQWRDMGWTSSVEYSLTQWQYNAAG